MELSYLSYGERPARLSCGRMHNRSTVANYYALALLSGIRPRSIILTWINRVDQCPGFNQDQTRLFTVNCPLSQWWPIAATPGVSLKPLVNIRPVYPGPGLIHLPNAGMGATTTNRCKNLIQLPDRVSVDLLMF